MKIAVNCWVLRNKQLDGIGYFTVNTISRVIKNHPEVEFLILCDKNFTENYFDFPNATKHPVFPALRHPVLYVWYMEFVLPLFLRKHKPDLMVSMEGFLSLMSGTKQMPAIYDINFEHQPQDLKFLNRLYFRFFFKRFVKKATRIATISNYSKQDIASFYKVNPDKIDNVSCGINGSFDPLTENEIAETRLKFSDGKPYFFFVGSMHPRKNIKRLIEAYTLFRKNTPSNYKLLLAGAIWWSKSTIEEAFNSSPFKDDIIFTGRLSEEDLKKVLGSAFALSFVPIFEGFGLPIVEAFQSHIPVLCSNTTSMPEVAGDAAILIDPFNIVGIAAGMEKLFADDTLRGRLVQLGNLQKEKFTWDNTAELFWQSIYRALQ
ncbi:MAG: glycosyltransferase family 1 protein, partial [Bacteroidota bacterium]